MRRKGEIDRTTKETDISLRLSLDGQGEADISTGIGFLNHMLTAFTVHSGFDLKISCKGDLDVDGHHTAEDVGICLGQAFDKALTDNKDGIARFGSFTLPMDEALARCTVDVCGRAFFVFDADFRGPMIGDLDSQLVGEFWGAFAANARITLHLTALYGENDHHKCEAMFKAAAHALKAAVKLEGDRLLSSKGAL